MTTTIECETEIDFSFDYEKLAEAVIVQALDAEEFPYEAEVSLTLTDSAGMQEINASMRGIETPTDVLSFPMLSCAFPGDFSEIETSWEGVVNPDTGEVLLGDIVINVERVREQAKAYGHSEKREYAFLITHSMLHLMGYDHMVPEEAAQMEERQRIILEGMQITR